MQYPGASEREQFQETQRSLINALVSGLIEGTRTVALASGAGNCDDVRQHPTRLAAFTTPAGDTVARLKRFLRGNLYCSPVLAEGRVESTRKMARLFEYLLAAPEKLPEPHSSHVQSMPVHRAVCDYIAKRQHDRRIFSSDVHRRSLVAKTLYNSHHECGSRHAVRRLHSTRQTGELISIAVRIWRSDLHPF